MTWLVRSWAPGSEPRDFLHESTFEEHHDALDAFNLRADIIRLHGGACELVAPSGDVAASIMAGGEQ